MSKRPPIAKKREEWRMPDWMKPYRDHIKGDGGNEVEELVNDLRINGSSLAKTNIIVYVIASGVAAQVEILTRLHDAGLLVSVDHKS